MTEVLVAMIGGLAVVCAAVIPVVLQLRKARNENRAQHADNKAAMNERMSELHGKLDVIHTDVRDVSTRLDAHMRDHAPSVQPAEPTTSNAAKPRKRGSIK